MAQSPATGNCFPLSSLDTRQEAMVIDRTETSSEQDQSMGSSLSRETCGRATTVICHGNESSGGGSPNGVETP